MKTLIHSDVIIMPCALKGTTASYITVMLCSYDNVITMAVATIEADEAVASSVFVQIMGTSLKKLLVRVILVIFGHFASSDFKVWLR